MVPVCDVVPKRTVAWVAFIVAGGFVAWTAGGGVTAGDALWVLVHAWGLVLIGPAVEDQLGHDRFAMLVASGGVAVALGGPAIARDLVLVSALVLVPVATGYVALFPTSQLVAVVPGVPPRMVELPAIVVAGCWTLLLGIRMLLDGPTFLGRHVEWVAWSFGALAVWGCLAARVLRRRHRLSPDWWEGEG
jgi:hypothetical protein